MTIRFRRKQGAQLVLELTAYDRREARQSLAGAVNMRATISRMNGEPVIVDDAAHVTINEVDAATRGDFTYSRPPDDPPILIRGQQYRVDFAAVIGGQTVKFPEHDYIRLEII